MNFFVFIYTVLNKTKHFDNAMKRCFYENYLDGSYELVVTENFDANLIDISSGQQSVIVEMETHVPQSHDSSQQQQNMFQKEASFHHQLNHANTSMVQNETSFVVKNELQQEVCSDGFNGIQFTFNLDEILRLEANSHATVDELVNVNQEINEPNATNPVAVGATFVEPKGKVVNKKMIGATKRKFSTDEPRNKSTQKCRKIYKEEINRLLTKIPSQDEEISKLGEKNSNKKNYIAGQENYSPQSVEDNLSDSSNLIFAKIKLEEAKNFNVNDSGDEERGQKLFEKGLTKARGNVLAIPEGNWNVYYQRILEKICDAQMKVIKYSKMDYETLSKKAEDLHAKRVQNNLNLKDIQNTPNMEDVQNQNTEKYEDIWFGI